ncbi:hypothetical protein B7463_g8172, partial [Scytalidium lignicola]
MDKQVRRKPVPTWPSPDSNPSSVTQPHDNAGSISPPDDRIFFEESSSGVSDAFLPQAHTGSSADDAIKPSPVMSVAGYHQPGTEPGMEEAPRFHRRTWNPFWLQLPILASLTIIFAFVPVALLVLYFMSNDRSGFRVITTNHYSWTYGPTALIVIVSTLWSQVDYNVRSLVPWHNLRRGACKPERSILLDYISPISIIRVFRAVKYQDWVVLAATIVLLLLKLATIISTGLISLEPTLMTTQNETFITRSVYDATNLNFSNIDTTPTYTFYGVSSLGLTFPNGTLDNVAVPLSQPLESDRFPSNATLSWQATAFYPNFNCERGTWSFTQPNPQDITLQFNATVSTATCHVTTELSAIDPTQLQQFPWNEPDRYLLTVSETNNAPKVTSFSAAFCIPEYRLVNSDVTLDGTVVGGTNGLSVSPVTSASNFTLDGLSSTVLGAAVMNATQGFFLRATNARNISENVDYFFGLMSSLNHPNPGTSTLEPFLETENLIQQAQKAFSSVAVQFAARNLLAPSNATLIGTVSFQENRLHVQKVSVILMVVIFLLSFCLSILVGFFRPWNIVPHNPNTIAGIAVLLQSSTTFKRMLSGTGRMSFPSLSSRSSGHEFGGVASGESTFLIEPADSSTKYETSRIEKPANLDDQFISWWRPFGAKLYMRLISLVVPLAVIAILEIIQHKSDHSDGFVNIGLDNKSTRYAISWLPALAMFGIAALYGSVNFATSVLAPYHTLWRGSKPADKSISVNLFGKSALIVFVHGARAGFWAVCATALASFLASFLTIVTDIANNDSAAGSLTSLIIWSNLSYPLWTYQDLVFPTLDLSPDSIESSTQSSDALVTVTIPAVRARLNCTVNPPISVTASSEEFININATYLDTCSEDEPTTGFFDLSILIETNDKQTFGDIQDLHVFSNDGTSTANTQEVGNVEYPTNAEGCPSLVFFLGQFFTSPPTFSNKSDDSPIDADVSVLVCTQALQQVKTRTTFLMPNFDIDPNHPPEVNESSAIFITNGTAGDFIREYQIFNNIVAEFPNPTVDDVDFDPGAFYSAVISGKDGIPVGELLGQSNVDRLINATNYVYAEHMAQTISLNMRQNNSISSDKDVSSTFPGILSQSSQLRLKQNKASKITLQVFLGIIFLSGIAGWLLMDTRNLLTHNPCSIAGTASFLADSKIWEDENFFESRVGSSHPGDHGQAGLFGGKLFSLGWWSEDREGTVRFGIDVGDALRRVDTKR